MRLRIRNPLSPRAIYRPPISPPPRACFCTTSAAASPLSTTPSHQPKLSDPLKILFCGSDEFSIAALRALHREHHRNSDLIKTLDVVVRPPKPTGRGMKQLRKVPLESEAQDLGLRVHELDTFTGWTPSFNVNLIIAVSFGLLVPPRLLRQAKYGGLNVHPSLLPDLRGPAPLHHTLLHRRQHTGVTLQTLHESKFDHGTVLAQTPPPGIPVPKDATLQTLHDLVTPLAADLLVDSLRRGLHVPPLQDVSGRVPASEPASEPSSEPEPKSEQEHTLRHAPKVTKQHRNVQWPRWSAADFTTHQNVLGELWSEARAPGEAGEAGPTRIIFDKVEVASPPLPQTDVADVAAGSSSPPTAAEAEAKYVSWLWSPPAQRGRSEKSVPDLRETKVPYYPAGDKHGAVLMPVAGDGWVRIKRIKVAGKRYSSAVKVLAGFAIDGRRVGD